MDSDGSSQLYPTVFLPTMFASWYTSLQVENHNKNDLRYVWLHIEHVEVQADWGRKLDLWLGSLRLRHFVGIFSESVQAPTQGQPFFYGYSEKPPHLVAF